MDVHPPHGAIYSVKEFMVHLLAITIGLLIALGLEASVEWVHHRHQAQEARENISLEIHDNQQRLAKELKALPTEEKQLESMLTGCGRSTENARAVTRCAVTERWCHPQTSRASKSPDGSGRHPA